MGDESTGVTLIARERARQLAGEGWTDEHDDNHGGGELVDAAIAYASPRMLYVKADGSFDETVVFMQVWPRDWQFKSDVKRINGRGLDRRPVADVNTSQRDERVRDLTKAGALIAAEIDRLLRFRAADEPALQPNGS